MATIRKQKEVKPIVVMSRLEIANTLKNAVVAYYSKKNYSCYKEFGITPWGKRKLDVFVMNMKAKFVGVEIKSCAADYNTDKKWPEYIPYVGAFYFCISVALYEKIGERIIEDCKEHGAGIMVLGTDGLIHVAKNAKHKKVCRKERKRILIKAAWRGGESKRIHKRLKRYYIT